MKTTYALAAKNLKQELMRAFPATRFRVRSQGFSGGDSVDVHWDFGPTVKQVEALANRYEEGHFDGMQDLYEYDNSPLKQAFTERNGGAKYVICQRSYGDMEAFYDRVAKDMCALQGREFSNTWQRGLFGGNDQESLNAHIHRLLTQTDFGAFMTYDHLEFGSEPNAVSPFRIVFAAR